jgi:hypothetical protein
MFEIFEMDIPGYVAWYHDNWGTMIIGVVIVLAVSVYIAFSVSKLFSFNANDRSPGYRFLLPGSIKRCYQNLVEIIYFPLGNIQTLRHNQSELSDYLREVSHSDIELKTEIEALLAREGKRLARLCKHYLQIVSAVVSVLLVLVIFFFLVSAYAPIFVLGDVI